MQESWYEKLNRWDEALEAYSRKYQETPVGSPAHLEAALGRLRSVSKCSRVQGSHRKMLLDDVHSSSLRSSIALSLCPQVSDITPGHGLHSQAQFFLLLLFFFIFFVSSSSSSSCSFSSSSFLLQWPAVVEPGCWQMTNPLRIFTARLWEGTMQICRLGLTTEGHSRAVTAPHTMNDIKPLLQRLDSIFTCPAGMGSFRSLVPASPASLPIVIISSSSLRQPSTGRVGRH